LAWRAFFQQSRTPVFVLGKGRRLRFANAAWEALTGRTLADELGLVCSSRKSATALAAVLAPPDEVLAGRSERCRRSAPNHRTGPPWWDITFIPLAGDGDLLGIVSFIEVVGEGAPAAARKVPAPVMAIRDAHADHFTIDRLTGDSTASRRLASQLRLAAAVTAPVWILGEAGSGKESAARAIHRAGPGRDRSFLALDCAGLQPYLIESLLWGHGGLAGSDRLGAVYLREPSALPRELQQKFAEQFAQPERKGPRLFCGSARPALSDVKAGTLLPEFHTALSALVVTLPPLAERLDDLPRFVMHLLGKPLDEKVTAVLAAHAWPGHFRELRDVLAAASAAAGDGPILREHLPRSLRERLGVAKPAAEPSLQLDAILEATEKRLIVQALAKTNGNATKAAALLGIWRPRLLRRIEALGLSATEEGAG
jgi:DNA-binding NtrC family response regulator